MHNVPALGRQMLHSCVLHGATLLCCSHQLPTPCLPPHPITLSAENSAISQQKTAQLGTFLP